MGAKRKDVATDGASSPSAKKAPSAGAKAEAPRPSAMAPRKGRGTPTCQWRQNDKARRQAIHAFVKSQKDELLKDIPRRALRNKETKRNELVRLGRIRFMQLPEEEQARFLEKTVMQADEPQASNSTSGVVADGGVSVSRSPDRGAHAVGNAQLVAVESAQPAPAAALSAAVAFRCLGVGGDSAVKNRIMISFKYLQKKFPGPRVFDVLAAAFRLLEQLGTNWQGETDRVKAAICLGIGAKLAAVSPSFTLDIWRHFTSSKMIPFMRSVELRMVQAWAKVGL